MRVNDDAGDEDDGDAAAAAHVFRTRGNPPTATIDDLLMSWADDEPQRAPLDIIWRAEFARICCAACARESYGDEDGA